MRGISIKCPECGASVSFEEKREYCFCPYCGTKIYLDDGKKEVNINIHKINENWHRHTDDAEVIKARNEEKENKRSWIIGITFFIIFFGFLFCVFAIPYIEGKIAESQGKVSIGSYDDMVGKDYKSVEASFEAAGFDNIEVIDLHDSGVLFWKNNKVTEVSVGGNTSFQSTDHFSTDTKVVISHH